MSDSPGWFKTFAVWVGIVMGLIALACTFGPDRWFSSSSAVALHELLPIPWPIYGIGFAFASLGLVHTRTRTAAYFTGFVLTGWFVAATVYFTIFADEIRNVIVSLLVLLTPLALLAGVRYAAQRSGK